MSSNIPSTWMPSANMKRIHLHWTAGGHKANSVDKNAYHILIEGDGKLVRGDHSIKANERPIKGKYAAHTAKANTGAIGVSMCCMRKSREGPFDPGPSPLTRTQWETAAEVIAQLAKKYDIPVTPTTILTHAEVEPNLNIKQKNKWDITRLAFDDSLRGHKACGDDLRRRVAVAMDKEAGIKKPVPIDDDMVLPKYRVTGVEPSTLNFRDAPGGAVRGSLPERSVVERITMDGPWWKVRTSAGFVGWVHSSFLVAK